MAFSTPGQDNRFYELMEAIKGHWHSPHIAGADTLMESIDEAFQNDEISTSQYDKLVRECEELL